MMTMVTVVDPEKFRALIDINARLNSSVTDYRALLETIVDSAARLADAEAASLALFDPRGAVLRFVIATGPKAKELRGMEIPSNEGIAGWVFSNARPLMVNDAAADSRFSPSVGNEISYATRSILAVPLKIRDRVEGVIELVNKKAGGIFTGDDLSWLEIFAVQAGIALDNARVYDKARNELDYLQQRTMEQQGWHPLVYASKIMQDRLDLVKRVAPSEASVLILGESGVGKELIAEQIHLLSKRAGKPFVRVNCAALPESLLESELFGHVRGAFTDAVQDRAGRFEAAEGGTIFLDEIAELPLRLQAKLLRVIQQKTFERVGSSTTRHADVRILAATNRDIEAMVKAQQFRNDLYYRLNVLPIHIPPLRERVEDIPVLANHFLRMYAREMNRPGMTFSDEAMQHMLSYAWPGNIRELENAIERAVLIAKSSCIGVADLMLGNAPAATSAMGEQDLREAVTQFKRQFILSALERNRWNQTRTAHKLNIQRTYLSRLIKELNILQTKE